MEWFEFARLGHHLSNLTYFMISAAVWTFAVTIPLTFRSNKLHPYVDRDGSDLVGNLDDVVVVDDLLDRQWRQERCFGPVHSTIVLIFFLL